MNSPLRSVVSLEQRIDRFFRSRQITDWEFLSIAAPGSRRKEYHGTHLVLLGDSPFFFSFLSQFPVHGSVHLWTLSTALRNVLVNVGGIPASAIGIIPRYELYPSKKLSYPLREIDRLIYAGRDVEGKNLHLARMLANQLNLSLEVCGPGEPRDFGDDWVSSFPGRPGAITLSHYRYEDFSVSIAEAQAAGLPVICPNWFGFCDVTGDAESVLKLSANPTLLGLNASEDSAIEKWKNEFFLDPKDLNTSSQLSGLSRAITSQELRHIIAGRSYSQSLALYEFFTSNFDRAKIDTYSTIISNLTI